MHACMRAYIRTYIQTAHKNIDTSDTCFYINLLFEHVMLHVCMWWLSLGFLDAIALRPVFAGAYPHAAQVVRVTL